MLMPATRQTVREGRVHQKFAHMCHADTPLSWVLVCVSIEAGKSH